MIRGPVLPQLREGLWSLVAGRLDTIESGLALVLEALDCSDGQLGAVEGLARDALGAPVLVMLAIEGDSLLPARALAAGEFVRRIGDGLVTALPEAGFCPGLSPRLLVIGTEQARLAIAQVQQLPIPELQICVLEPFRIGGSERFAVRWLAPALRLPLAPTADPRVAMAGMPPSRSAAPGANGAPSFVAPEHAQSLVDAVTDACTRLDDDVRLHGDRYSRRITWHGRLLGELRTTDGALLGTAATGVTRELRDARDVRLFVDQLLRAFLACASEHPHSRVATPSGAARAAATRHAAVERARPPVGGTTPPRGGDSLRSTLAAAQLSPEEYSALGGPVVSTGGGAVSFVAEDSKTSIESGRPPAARSD